MQKLYYTIQNYPHNTNKTIQVKGALRATNAVHFKKQMCEYLKVCGQDTTLDLTEITDIDLTGLNSLLIAKKSFQREKKILRLQAPRLGQLNELARVTKFEQYLDVAGSC